jgi:hypothetical protein
VTSIQKRAIELLEKAGIEVERRNEARRISNARLHGVSLL